MSNAIGSSRESNPSRRICHLRTVPLSHVADSVMHSELLVAVQIILLLHSMVFYDCAKRKLCTSLYFRKHCLPDRPNEECCSPKRKRLTRNFVWTSIWQCLPTTDNILRNAKQIQSPNPLSHLSHVWRYSVAYLQDNVWCVANKMSRSIQNILLYVKEPEKLNKA